MKMKAFILAAGLGTRLKPWTLYHPKALVPVKGIPMLQRVIDRVREYGFEEIVVNVHHFAEQIEEFFDTNPIGHNVRISDEREALLETGGAVLNAADQLTDGSSPFLVHNVDILSNAPLDKLMKAHERGGAVATLLVSNRASSRKLVFDSDGRLKGWHHMDKDLFRPEGMKIEAGDCEMAFSGIYILSGEVAALMSKYGFSGRFSIIDFFLEICPKYHIQAFTVPSLQLIDIGKPATLQRAEELI